MSEQTKNPIGRPTKYKPEYCEQVVIAGKEGYSLTAFAGLIGVSRDTINEWMNTIPEFSVAAKEHKAVRAMWWETQLRKTGSEGGGNGQVTACIFALKNVDPDEWRDRQEVKHDGSADFLAALRDTTKRVMVGGDSTE